MPPLGIGYVAGMLEQTSKEVQILDAHVKKLQEAEIVRYLEDYKPDIIGLTFTTENRFEAFNTAKLVKSVLPHSHVTAGGPHVSLAGEDTLEGISAFDSVVAGEGERTFVELVQALEAGRSKDLRKIDGLVYRDISGGIIRTAARARIDKLDTIPFPARHLYPPAEDYNFVFDVPGYGMKRFVNMMTSRGCPCACNFCATPKVWGRNVRMRSPENIIKEIDLMVQKQGSEAIWFFDDTFNTSPNRVKKICAAMKERRYQLPWFCEVRVDLLSKELLADMKEAGCYTIGFGVESGNQRILDDVIGKNLHLSKVREVYSWCKELEVVANPFFIISHPTETWSEAQETLALIREFKQDAHVSMAFLHVYPGTDLEQTARENGVLPADFKWHQADRTDVKTLASAQGNVPIFLDKLSWNQISDILFEWAEMQNYSVWRKIPRVLKSIRSWDDFIRYSAMGIRFLRRKILR